MSNTSPLYTKTVVIGATSGIGMSLAARLASQGTKVIVTGRRQDRLDKFVAEHGADKASGYALDVTDFASIPVVTQRIIADHPDVDSVVLNAGIQRPFDFTRPETIDFDNLHAEVATNYTSIIHISMAFLPMLEKQQKETSLVYVNSTLGLVPSLIRAANYCATKAAMHAWVMAFRKQLQMADSKVKLVEVFPPPVQTEIHDTRHQPDLKDGGELGMPLETYTDGMMEGLRGGEQQFTVGPGKDMLEGFEATRQDIFHKQVDMIMGILKRFIR